MRNTIEFEFYCTLEGKCCVFHKKNHQKNEAANGSGGPRSNAKRSSR